MLATAFGATHKEGRFPRVADDDVKELAPRLEPELSNRLLQTRKLLSHGTKPARACLEHVRHAGVDELVRTVGQQEHLQRTLTRSSKQQVTRFFAVLPQLVEIRAQPGIRVQIHWLGDFPVQVRAFEAVTQQQRTGLAMMRLCSSPLP